MWTPRLRTPINRKWLRKGCIPATNYSRLPFLAGHLPFQRCTEKNAIMKDSLAQLKHQGKAKMRFYYFKTLDPSFYSHFNLACCFCALCRRERNISDLWTPSSTWWIISWLHSDTLQVHTVHIIQSKHKSKTASKLENEHLRPKFFNRVGRYSLAITVLLQRLTSNICLEIIQKICYL